MCRNIGGGWVGGGRGVTIPKATLSASERFLHYKMGSDESHFHV